MTYNADDIRQHILANQDELFTPYASGRPPNWSCDQATKDLVCVGNWLNGELRALHAETDDRRAMLWSYNRRSRASFDVFQLAADIMNEFLAGNVDRKPAHRRWG